MADFISLILSTELPWSKVRRKKRVRQEEQWRDTIEMRKHGAQVYTSALGDEDTSYRPRSAHSEDASYPDANESRAYILGKRPWLQGWRFGALMGACWACAVLIINLAVTIWGSTHSGTQPYERKITYQLQGQTGQILHEGGCASVRRLDSGLHFLINIMSTILLSASNYCMQCLTAPTRKEIDKAHAQGIWLDIGVPSFRNLRHISKHKVIVWFLLALSSLPLHLFYNSAVFTSTSSNDYRVFMIGQSFLDNDNCCSTSSATGFPFIDLLQDLHGQAHNKQLQNLTNAQCIRDYANVIQTSRRHVLLVVDDSQHTSANFSPIVGTSVYAVNGFAASDASEPLYAVDAYDWICTGIPDHHTKTCAGVINQVESEPDAWQVASEYGFSGTFDNPLYNVKYCLSEETTQSCRLEFIFTIMVIVNILNFSKVILLLYVALGMGRNEEPLITMGDAVASFLEEEDPTTKGMCLLSMHDAKQHKGYFPVGPKQWIERKYRWKDNTTRRRRAFTFILFTVMLIVIASLLAYGIHHLPPGQSRSISALARLGFGSISPVTIINFQKQLSPIQNILVANVAQPILSFLYFAYNGLFTSMLLGYEWASYAHERKGLRVSRDPIGAQRSAYYLELPYRYALPLMVLSSILHYLVSQSISLLAINAKALDGSGEGEWTSSGYSPMAIIAVLILGVFMVLAIVGFGFIPFKQKMVLAGSCSAAISAACHNADWDDVSTAATDKLKWGVVGTNSENVGHCTFSTKNVDFPRDGEEYAG